MARSYRFVLLLYPVVSRSSRGNEDVDLVRIYGPDCLVGLAILLSFAFYFHAGPNMSTV